MYAPTRYSRLRPWLWYALLLSLISLTVFGGVAADPGGQVVADNDDTSLFIWWFGHAAEVLAHGLGFGSGGIGDADGLFHTEAMNALAGGVNGAWNTSLTGPAILLAPLTLIAGPIVSYNAFVLAIPVLTSLATAVLFARFLPRLPAFIAAGGVGFSSYVIAQLGGHPNLAFAVTPPLTAAAIHGFLTGRGFDRRFWALSIGLGLLLGFQFTVSTELLAGTFLAAVCLVLAFAVVGRAATHRNGWLRLLLGGSAASVLALLCALPLLIAMTGPNAPSGAIRPHGVWNTDLLDPIIPAAPTLLSSGESPLPRIMDIDPAELGAYVGIPALLAALLILLALGRRGTHTTALRVSAFTGILVFGLALGSPVLLGGRQLLSTGPFALVEAIPVLTNILPMRLVLHSTIALFAILGIGLDWSLRHVRTPGRALRLRARGLLALLIVAAVCVVPGVQNPRPVEVPEFYTQSLPEVIPAGAVVKTFPRPLAWAEPHADEAMVWQAVADFRYRDTGGYFIGSSEESAVIYSAPEDALDEVLHDSVYEGAPLPDPHSDEVADAMDSLRDSGVDAIVLAPEAPLLPGGDGAYADFLDESLGEPIFAGEGVRVYRLSD